MATTKSSANLILGIIVAVLAITAGIFLFRGADEPGAQTKPAAAEAQLPDQHPPIDLAARVSALEQLMAREPQNPEYPAQIANLYYDGGDYTKAAEYYQRSLSIRPQDPSVETDLATCFHYLGQHDKSLEILDNVLRYNPGFAQAQFNKGIVLIEGKKDVKAGIAVWEELLRNPAYTHKAELEQRIQQLKASNP